MPLVIVILCLSMITLPLHPSSPQCLETHAIVCHLQATLGNLIGLERYVSSESSSKTFDMVDGEVYDGDKACKMVLPLQDFNMMRFRISVAMYRGKGKIH